ncbi:MAG TPA: S41 family peptidase [bacterium]|nr:S41 family peptidase [bacterium]
MRWRLAGLLAAALLLSSFTEAPHAWAADGSLVIAALHVLERAYVDPAQPVPLLNAAIATLRKATNQGTDALPNIAQGTPEAQADAQFASEFSRAAHMGAMPETQLAYAATQGMLFSLHDSHTYYLDPAALRESQRQLSGNPSFSGIGVTIASRKDMAGVTWVFVENVFPGSPAAQAGIKRFDRLVSVDGQSLKNRNALDASELLRGPAGTTTTIIVQRRTQTLQLTVTRAPIRVVPVQTSFIAPGVAYVTLFEFTRGAGQQLRSGLQRLHTQGPIRAVILDLRGDAGGLIVEAASVGGVFMPPHTMLARIHERGQAPSLIETSGQPLLPRTPLVVLVDGSSASASEILTGAFKDHKRATIIGARTAGALGGSVIVRLPEGGMSVTVERIVTPKNRQVEAIGITPDVAVSLTVADMERGQDPQLQAAVHALGTTRMERTLKAA